MSFFGTDEERQKRKEWLATLKVGDKVAIQAETYDAAGYYYIEQITHITPGRKFTTTKGKVDNDGNSYGNCRHFWHIEPITDKVRAANMKERYLRAVKHFERWEELTPEDLKSVCDILARYPEKQAE